MSESSFDHAGADVVPYFSQWESAELAPAFAAGTASLLDDPHWRRSGASSREEYATWGHHICGMACLKMVLAARMQQVVPLLELTRVARRYGAYTVDGQAIKGMIYAPFVDFVAHEFGLHAEVVVGLDASQMPQLLQRAEFFIASVHPAIRRPQSAPPAKGGHLVLVTAAEISSVTFHNPSGDDAASRASVRLPPPVFANFFAGRGVAIMPARRTMKSSG